jgi:O-antigen ligase
MKSIAVHVINNRNWTSFWERSFLSKWLPFLLGLGLGPLLALLIVDEAWPFLFALLLLVPVVILFNVWPFVTVILWLLVMPFFVATPNVAARYMYWMIHRAMIPIGLGVVSLSHLLKAKKYQPVRLGAAELTMGIFIVLVLASILASPSVKPLSIKFYDRILMPYCMYLLVRLAAPRKKDLKRLLVAALFIAVSQSVIGLLSWFAPQVLPSQWLAFRGARTTGSLKQPGVYTAALGFAIAVLFQAAMNRKPGLLRSVLLFAFGLGAICIFLSLSRGSWLGGSFIVLGLLVLFPKPMIRMALILLAIVAILGSGMLSSQMAWASERMNQENTIESRLAINDAMLTMVRLKPFFGWGYETQERYSWRFIRQIRSVSWVDLSSHNTYLTIMAEMGLVGFFFYVFPFVWWLAHTATALSRMPKEGLWSHSLLITFWLIVFNQVIVSNFIDMRFFPFGLALWWMTLGFIANVVFPYLESGGTRVPRWAYRAIG